MVDIRSTQNISICDEFANNYAKVLDNRNQKPASNDKPLFVKTMITDGDYDVSITNEGRMKTDTAITVSTALVTQIYGWNSILQQWVKINAEEYPPNSGEYWIGVFGEVGTRTKADNPINICIRKTLATQGIIVFLDETVTLNEVWYILKVGVADDIAAEFNVWSGSERDKVELFNGDGSTKTFILTKGAISNADYVKAKKYISGSWINQVLNSDFWVEDHLTNYNINNITFKTAPATGTNNVRITYDACIQKQGWFVQASSSFQADIDAPLKLIQNNYVIVGVRNKSANTGVVIANLSGFKEAI